ncbi:MAG TPA: carboxypeptidase regulatory-like domain-containing protein [Terriglobales bacterium]|nr:carboxypeptidase regulatory-like domain-containing protein [Terriglobales bacterium]
MKNAVLMLLALQLTIQGLVYAQAPAGAITGFVTDATGARIRGASVIVTNKDIRLRRTLLTTDAGDYSAPALLPGAYEVTGDAKGFKQTTRDAVVEAGNTTSVNLVMQVGAGTESVTVEGASPQIHYESHEIDGMVTRSQIEGLPLNGRNPLELAKLEPGAQQPTKVSNNRTLVPLLGAPVGLNGRATRVTVDGGSVMEIGNGGSAMGFSQEEVQEFEVSTVNPDLSAATAGSGVVNIATRSGSNQVHGSGFFFFRDHHLSAYPALHRNPFNPDPFFQRKQFGVSGGGPIRKDRVFFFGSFERLDQRGVISAEVLAPDFVQFSGIYPSPTYVNQFSGRTDFKLSPTQSMFVRYSHEGSSAYAGGGYPSTWPTQKEWADQSILGLTSQLGAHVMNDAHFSYFFVSFAQHAPETSDCPGCVGVGAPSIDVDSDFAVGVSTTTAVLGRRYHLNDVVSWQKGVHNIRFGGDWETSRGGRTNLDDEPITMSLFSPEIVRDSNALQPPSSQIPLPATFLTVQDILQLPLENFTVGIGDPFVPQAGFGKARVAPLVHLFLQDTWHLRPRFVIDYGLAWIYDAPHNYDLTKPQYLASVLGTSGLSPTHRNWKNFSPSLGFAWNVRRDGRTVIRGGVGVYYDFQSSTGISDEERVSLGPRGVGRGSYYSGGIRNPLTDVPGVPEGTLLEFPTPTLFTGVTALQAIPAIRTNLAQERGDPNNRDFSVTNIETDKQGSVVARDLPSPYAVHVSLGVQREVMRDLVISMDFVVRHFEHASSPGLLDANHFDSVQGRVLPLCSVSEATDPKALCSLGPIALTSGFGTATYRGLRVRAEKRFSHGLQFLASYAYASNVGDNFGNGFNLDNPSSNRGPLDRDVRHILSISGLGQLPKGFQVGLFVSYISKPPFSAYLGGLDLNGDGTWDDLLPGAKVNQFNRGLGKSDLRHLVDAFNITYAGGLDPHGDLIPTITLPPKFEFGDSFLTQDLRLSREFHLHDRWRMNLIGEVFNLFNIPNLSGRSGDLLFPGFGEATSRVSQVFGSGGPRAFQVAARLSF